MHAKRPSRERRPCRRTLREGRFVWVGRAALQRGVEVAHLERALGGFHIAAHDALQGVVGILMVGEPPMTEFDQRGGLGHQRPGSQPHHRDHYQR